MGRIAVLSQLRCLLTGLVVSVVFGGGLSAAEPTKLALLVGVNQYEKRGLAERPLDYAEADIESLSTELSKATHGFRCTKLIGNEATKGAIQAAVRELLGTGLPADAIVLIALAGHGRQIEIDGKEDACFCPFDAAAGDGSTMISLTELMHSLDRRGGVNLVLVDACRDDPSRGGGKSRSITGNELEGRLPANTAVLFSCAARQQALETDQAGGGHGVFFYHVLEGIRGAAADSEGDVTWDNLVTYVRPRVNARAKEWFPDRAKSKLDGALQTPHQLTNLVAIPVLGRPAKPAVAALGRAKEPPKETSFTRLQLESQREGLLREMEGLADDESVKGRKTLLQLKHEIAPSESLLKEIEKAEPDSFFKELGLDSSFTWSRHRVQALIRRGKIDDARALCDASEDDMREKLLLSAVDELLVTGAPDQAVKIAERLREYVAAKDAWGSLMMHAYRSGDSVRAHEHLKKSEEHDASLPISRCELILALFKSGSTAEALRMTQELEHGFFSDDTYASLAELTAHDGNLDQAIEYANRIQRRDYIHYSRALSRVGCIAALEERTDIARSLLEIVNGLIAPEPVGSPQMYFVADAAAVMFCLGDSERAAALIQDGSRVKAEDRMQATAMLFETLVRVEADAAGAFAMAFRISSPDAHDFQRFARRAIAVDSGYRDRFFAELKAPRNDPVAKFRLSANAVKAINDYIRKELEHREAG
jgi:hypothetical protein